MSLWEKQGAPYVRSTGLHGSEKESGRSLLQIQGQQAASFGIGVATAAIEDSTTRMMGRWSSSAFQAYKDTMGSPSQSLTKLIQNVIVPHAYVIRPVYIYHSC